MKKICISILVFGLFSESAFAAKAKSATFVLRRIEAPRGNQNFFYSPYVANIPDALSKASELCDTFHGSLSEPDAKLYECVFYDVRLSGNADVQPIGQGYIGYAFNKISGSIYESSRYLQATDAYKDVLSQCDDVKNCVYIGWER